MAGTWILSAAFFSAIVFPAASSTTFTVKNNCPFTIWPATLTGRRSALLPQTGLELAYGESQSLDAPAGWSGRFWARTRCTTDSTSGRFSCASGDCGSGSIECNGAGGAPPTTLVEFTLQGDGGKDFYDVSCVDGFNLPVSVTPRSGQGCSSISCPADTNAGCPPELQERARDGAVVGCKSACLAFDTDWYCCRGAYGTPSACKPTNYSMLFKNACPQAYSYAYDDATSTFTCVGANYLITFCP
ncbi:thaumatin-like protein 1b [Musa acuminata AAA Group]|uniref:thaumatin-like protein 1b n=1 Tax=Musa acuminata AAA Group TaxID=214697 RepID=UPI0031D89CAD